MKLIRKVGLKFSRGANRNHSVFECVQCDNEVIKETSLGIKALTCGCRKKHDFINGVRIIKYLDMVNGRVYVMYECPSCHKPKKKIAGSLVSGSLICKECASIDNGNRRRKYHTKEEKRISLIYRGMKQRCYNNKSVAYHNYGGNGIGICKEWLGDIALFIEWSLNNGYRDHLSIDRRDNESGYSPGNCRWTTDEVQIQNTRLLRSTNTTGYRCVFLVPSGRYISKINFNNAIYRLGTYDTKREAALAYNNFVKINNTDHPLNIIEDITI